MSVKVARLGKVVLGTYKVSEMGAWTLDGITNDMIEHQQFGDLFKSYEFGLGDGGTLTFSGNFDMTDTNGQVALDNACKNKTLITNLKLYIDANSFYTPDQTLVSSSILMQKVGAVAFATAGVGTISFSAKVSGIMVLQ